MRNIKVGDRVAVEYVQNEDSCPTWKRYYTGTVLSMSGPEYAPDVVVETDENGIKEVSTGACADVVPE